MQSQELIATLRDAVVGHSVRERRLAANSLLVYVDCSPGDHSGVVVWLEPAWQFLGPMGVLTGSRQAQEDETADEPLAGFEAAGVALEAMLGRSITDWEIEPRTFSLLLSLEGGYSLRTFVTDPTDDLDWYAVDNKTGFRLEACSSGMRIGLPDSHSDC